ncbi:hypothetical protein ACJJIW_16665 [Microbulbifer sp. JMSA004]|uniref:hypothetical protein n=1 Tax=Microbulbifer sp. JMSA004 TaxID=3243370 RepID=UPI00403A3282
MSKTAAELMAELAKNKEYQAMKKAQNERLTDLEKLYADDERELVKELNQAGFAVASVWDFVNSKNDYMGAVPILIKHLKNKHHPKILAGLARSLAVAEFSSNDELWSVLVELYNKAPSDSEIDIPEERGAQEAIAVALESLALSSRTESLKKLIEKNQSGDGIHWLRDKLKELS